MERIAIGGTPFEIGEALGRLGRPARGLVAAATRELRGKRVMPCMERIRDSFPGYWDELRGISAGMALDMRDVLLWNCRLDLAPGHAESGTVAVNRLGYGLILNALRLGPALAAHCTLIDVAPEGRPGFLSLYVPGCLPGASFGANRAGVVQVVDHLAGEETGAGLPSFLIARAVLDAGSLPEAIDTVMDSARFGSAHYVLASTQEFIMIGIAATPSGCELAPIPNKYWSANHRAGKSGDDGVTAASLRRYRAMSELMECMPSHPTERDILALLES
ncbi:C45 family autoproteolytic acyltransferase/hydolase, partial [Noviherbaspirillum denitrificans]